MTSPGLLGLFHPDGTANRVAILGSACPPVFGSSTTGQATVCTPDADLVVVAPSPDELREPRWLDRALGMAANGVAPNGLVYVLVPPRRRRKVRRRLAASGLTFDRDVLHVPTWAVTHQALPLERAAIARAIGTSASLAPWRRQIAERLLVVPGAAGLLGLLHEAVALVARPTGARPLFAWLLHAARMPAHGASVLVRAKWQANAGAIVLQVIDATAQPIAVAKTALGSGAQGRSTREIDCLTRFGPAARSAGATVPEACAVFAGTTPVALETIVPGVPTSMLLDSRRVSVAEVLDRLARWLEAWSRLTVVRRPLELACLERTVLEPARALASHLEGGADYVAWLAERCRAAAGSVAPFVVTHGDLTMSNVLWAADGAPGIVDWEMATADGFPLGDFWYAAADAAAAVDRYVDRPRAFIQGLTGDGPLPRLVAGHAAQLARALDLSDAFATLCFHGCWLHHAANEQRKRRLGEARPFQAIVQSLVAHPHLPGTPTGSVT